MVCRLHLWWRRQRFALMVTVSSTLGAILLGTAAVLGITSSASAEEPNAPVGQPPCIGMPRFDELALDPSLNLGKDLAAVVGKEDYAREDGSQGRSDVVNVSWSAPAGGASCIWVTTATPSDDTLPIMARFILPGDAKTLRYVPPDAPGRYCLRFIGLAKGRRGAAQDVCFESTEPRSPAVRFAARADVPSADGSESRVPELLVGVLAGVAVILSARFLPRLSGPPSGSNLG